MSKELSYDGKGINGPDEHRSRVATFQNGEAAKKYGPLFEASPELYEVVRWVTRCAMVQVGPYNAYIVSDEMMEKARKLISGLLKRRYYVLRNVGKSKYVVNFYDGEQKHRDGSEFYDTRIFSNKRKMEKFIKDLLKDGYTKE